MDTTIYCWSGGLGLVAWHVHPAALAPGSVDLLALSRYRVLMMMADAMMSREGIEIYS